MSQYLDCYWLNNSRSIVNCKSFLNQFLPERKETTVDYPVPLHADRPLTVYSDVDELMSYLANNPNEEYLLYWRNVDDNSSYGYGMIFYTNDGKMILGLSIRGKDPENEAVKKQYMYAQKFLNASIGCITVEEVAPLNSVEFKEFCQNRYIPST